jgi:thiamine-monophosphate kinase
MGEEERNQALSEEEVIRLVQSLAGESHDELVVGIGDDAAVLRLGGQAICVTTDLMLEGVHFDLAYMKPFEVGWRAMAANLSDLAAMGARPRWGLLSLGLTPPVERELVEGLLGGVMELASAHGLTLAGGDTVASPRLLISLCLLGAAEPRRPVLRRGAHPGDAVCVTGRLGEAAAGLAWLKRGGRRDDPLAASAVECFLRPAPRVAAGRALAQSGRAHAMMDISDGLASDLARLCQASQVGATVEERLLPIGDHTRAVAQALGTSALDWALAGGEDFELLFTCAPQDVDLLAELVADQEPGLAVTRVGEVHPGRGVFLRGADGRMRDITLTGFDHFRRGETA